MKIEFHRTGGLVPISLSANVDVDQLPETEANELRQLMESARLSERGEEPVAPMPDEYSYNLVVITDDGKCLEVKFTDGSVPSRLRPLLRWLTSRSKRESV